MIGRILLISQMFSQSEEKYKEAIAKMKYRRRAVKNFIHDLQRNECVSLDQIAKDHGVNRSGLYYHFKMITGHDYKQGSQVQITKLDKD